MGQFKALTFKNLIMFKRGPLGSALQILLPILFALFLILVRKLATIDYYSQQQFITNSTYTYTHYGNPLVASAVLSVPIPAIIKNCSGGKIIALAPSGYSMVTTLNSMLSTSGYIVQQFGSDTQIDNIARDANYGIDYPLFCFGISFENSGSDYKYNLRFNITNGATSTDAPSPNLDLTTKIDTNLPLYIATVKSGYISVTNIINNLILQAQTASTNMLINKQGPIYQQSYVRDPIYNYLGTSSQFLILLPLLIVYLRQTSSMLYQKQKKIRQSMSISGMKTWIYYLTWFIRYFISYFIIHIIVSAIITGIFPHIPYYIPFVVFILFDILLIIQCFFIQIFVTRAKIGIIVALLFFILQYVINYIVANNQDATSRIYRGVSIVPHVAFILAFKEMIYAESIKTGLNFTVQINQYTIVTAIISIIGNIIFWGVLAWYLDQVFPNQWGAKKHPCFCCYGNSQQHIHDDNNNNNKQINYQQLNKSVHNSAGRQNNMIQMGTTQKIQKDVQIQSVQGKYKQMQNNNNIIRIKQLNKIYDGDMHAVKDLSMNIYSDQIFVLLGHNGAGKTSTISMLTGMIKPTSGMIQILGATKLDQIRQKIGVCPQHDTLYQDLTVQEHIRLFSTFRGLQNIELQQQVDKLVKDVNLQQKRNQYSKNLSGGQKRRLSVAMAFAGGAKVIILDQPTSGMDTSARRYIWQMLKNYKNNRIILLTTHFMDQADYLGDRIAIMAGGRLVALGSNVYLKNKFGVGYSITFVKKSINVQTQPIMNCVLKYINTASILTDVSSQVAIQLPMDKINNFSKLFDQIDSKKQQLGIETYGISITTLQEVFLKVGEQEDQRKQQQKKLKDIKKYNNVKQTNVFYTNSNAISPQKSLPSQSRPSSPSKLQQSPQKYEIQLQLQKSNKSKSNSNSKSDVKQINNDKQLQQQQNWIRQDGVLQRFWSHFLATILKRLRVIKRDLKSFIFQLILPMAIILLALLLMRVSFIKDFPSQTLTYNTYSKQGTPILVPIGSSTANAALLTSLKTKMQNTHGSLLNVQTYQQNSVVDFDAIDLYNLKKQNNTIKGGIYFQAANIVSGINKVPFTSIINTKSPTSVITVQTLAAQTYINHIKSSGAITITPILKPFPRTYKQLRLNNTISGFFGALIFSIALSFKFASIVSFIVKQRQDKSKHQQIVSGMNVVSYWLGNYVYDFVLYLIVAIFSVGMCQALKIQALITGQAYAATCLLFLFFGLANIPLTYILGYIFKDYGNAQGAIYFFNFVTGGIVTIVILVLRWIDQNSNKVGRGLAWPLRIIPSFAFGQGLVNLGSVTILSIFQNNGKDIPPFNMQIALAPIIFLVVFGAIFVALMFVLQWLQNNQNFMRFFTSQHQVDQTIPVQDTDVLAEQKKAIQADPNQYQILTKQLRKVYMLDSQKKYKVAVDNLSFGINKGQVFGLLGVNGAGKTTTFKMLAGEIVSTSGESYLRGRRISQNLATIRKSLGYCPQFDALIQNLTVKQQLELFYDMKCLPKKYKQMSIQRKIKQMNLQQYTDKLSGTLSGGNKRKLSVAMAMIGNPSIIFLDQPSTGMDPKARRFMWKVISRISTQRKQSTVILTTHSMEEAEALSTRLGIMVSGNFKCIGTPQYIKSKYGKGFEIQIKLKNVKKDEIENVRAKYKIEGLTVSKDQFANLLTTLQVSQATKKQLSKQGTGNYIWHELDTKNKCSINQIIQFELIQTRVEKVQKILSQKLGKVQILQHFQTYVRFKTQQNVKVGKLFQFLQAHKNQLYIMQYSIRQATVQQIFNKFAEEQGGQMD